MNGYHKRQSGSDGQVARPRKVSKARAKANALLRRGGALSIYLRDISKYQPLKSEQEASLAVKIRAGDQKALDRLVRANLRFVVSVARNYQNQGLPLEDLVNEGTVGLIRAAYRFDERKNFKFISYAVWWIRQAILQALANQSRSLRVPLNCVGKIYQVGRASERLEQKYFRAPDESEISQETGVGESEVRHTIRASARVKSLDEPTPTRAAPSLADSIPDRGETTPDESVLQHCLRQEIDEMLSAQLSHTEQHVIRRYFGLGDDSRNTLDEIGHQSNLTRERVRQIKETALRKLRSLEELDDLREYVVN